MKLKLVVLCLLVSSCASKINKSYDVDRQVLFKSMERKKITIIRKDGHIIEGKGIKISPNYIVYSTNQMNRDSIEFSNVKTVIVPDVANGIIGSIAVGAGASLLSLPVAFNMYGNDLGEVHDVIVFAGIAGIIGQILGYIMFSNKQYEMID